MTTENTTLAALLLTLASSLGCAPAPAALQEEESFVAEQSLRDELEARGPYLRCFEEEDEVEGSTRSFGGLAAGDVAFEILERRAAAPCTYTLSIVGGRRGEALVRDDVPLPEGQTLHVEAQRVGQVDLYVVNRLTATFVRHPDGHYETTSPRGYEIVALTRHAVTGRWSAPVTLATHASSAVWFLGLEAHSGATFTVHYGVDRFHELLFFSDLGRGRSDGTYARSFSLVGADGTIALERAERVGGYVLAARVEGMERMLDERTR